MIPTEKQLSTKATTDSFDEIYTNFDLSVNDTYRPDLGYPFDYPTRWLNDPSMNKRIAIRRLSVTPSSHSFTLKVTADVNEKAEFDGKQFEQIVTINVTYQDNLIKVLSFLCESCQYQSKTDEAIHGGMHYDYNPENNALLLWFTCSTGECNFSIEDVHASTGEIDNITSFLRFLNQDEIMPCKKMLEQADVQYKEFNDVWNRDLLYFHASFSTSRRQFIGKRGDFYQNLTLLYPPPTNESTFYIRFSSNGIKHILLRYCDFDVQLCYIVNYRKATIL